jgi:hypothetical protein
MGWSELLAKLSEVPAAKAHIDLLKEQIRTIEKERDDARNECDALRDECSRMRNQLSGLSRRSEFVDHDGLLWKRGANGKIETAPYCPHCAKHPKMTAFPPMGNPFEWICAMCKWGVACNTITAPR